jgi:pyrroloquinoline quinone biosynthesis protein B
VHQKGLDIIADSAREIVREGGQIAILGLGDPETEHMLSRLARSHRDNIGLLIREGTRSAFYAPGLGEVTPALFDVMAGADAVLVDGTFWTDDEMPRLGLSTKTARAIGHLPQSGPGGMIEWLDRLPRRTRRLLIHVNNTNPAHSRGSEEHNLLQRAGWEILPDGTEITL